MSDDRKLWEGAFGPTGDCPEIDQLGAFSDGTLQGIQRSAIEKHVAACEHCKVELDLLREFTAVEVRPEERESVQWIEEQLKQRAGEIVPQPNRQASWWERIFAIPMWGRAGIALACILFVAGAFTFLRRTSPSSLDQSMDGSVMRSTAVMLVSPAGDVKEQPGSFTWQPVPGAVRYQVRLQEVDRTELWKSEAPASSIALPEEIRSKILPAKTLQWQVIALDSSGNTVAESNLQRFRLMP